MKTYSVKFKIIAFILALAFTFQTIESINNHSYTTGFANFHYQCPKDITCCFGTPIHSVYSCGQTLHLP